jgi:hypothetical protein
MNLLQMVDPIYFPGALSLHTLIELFLLLRSLAEETGEYKLLIDALLPVVHLRKIGHSESVMLNTPLTSFASPLLLQTILSSAWHLSPQVLNSYEESLARVMERGELMFGGDVSLAQARIVKLYKNAGKMVFFFLFFDICLIDHFFFVRLKMQLMRLIRRKTTLV